MVRGALKSGRFRRAWQRLPGGRIAQRFKERRPGQAKCCECQKPLHGIPRFFASEARNAPKTAKRPERPYGGALCSACARQKLRERAS